jgi:hypothetical protein
MASPIDSGAQRGFGCEWCNASAPSAHPSVGHIRDNSLNRGNEVASGKGAVQSESFNSPQR